MRTVRVSFLLRFIATALLSIMLAAVGTARAQEKVWLGVEIQDLTKEESDKLGLPQGRGVRVVNPVEGGPAAAAGLVPGDILLSIDGGDVTSVKSFIETIQARPPGAQVQLRLSRGGKEQTLTATLGTRLQTAEEGVPQLMLDTGGHMALIRGLAFTPDGKQLVSASDDKVVRVWDWQAGKTVRTIRGQVGPGEEGKIIAMALSPDGRWLAAGGQMQGNVVRLYDFPTGKLVALLRGHKNSVLRLAFSPDNKHLISGSFDGTAILWDVESYALLHRLDGHKAQIYAAGFTLGGERAVTGSYDTTLRLWSVADGKEIMTLTGHQDQVFALAISPVDGTIASGSFDGEIRLWNGRTGQFLTTLANQGTGVGALSFSSDGKLLLSGIRHGKNTHSHVWEVTTGKESITYTKHDNIVLAAAVSPNGHLAATGGGNKHEVHVWDLRTGETKHVLAGTGAPNWAIGFSGDGRRIGWGSTHSNPTGTTPVNNRGPMEYELRLPGGTAGFGRPERIDAAGAKDFVRARATLGGHTLAHRKGGNLGYDAILDVTKNGQTIVSIEQAPADGYSHRSYTFDPDGQTIISGGGNGHLTAYDLKGTKLGKFVGHEGDVWAVTPSPDGRLLVSGSDDQTIRLWNQKTRELIVTLFHSTDSEWVLWTPQGYYASSPNGDRIVGWQINKGPDQAAEYVTASQLRHQFYRPDIVERAIVLGSAIKALEEMGRSRAGSFQLSDLSKRPPPKLSVLTPLEGSETMRGRAAITLALAETKNDPVKDFDVFVNDTKVTATGKRQGTDVSFEVPLGNGNNRIRVVARSKADLLGEANLEITQNGEGVLDKRDTLFIIAIGVDKYPQMPKACGPKSDASCDLSFAGADAKAFAETIEKQMGGQHKQVVKRILFNGAGGSLEPTRDNIESTLDLLLEAKDNDTVAVFIAGHGYNDPRTGYQFLPTNARPGDSGNWASPSVIKWTTLEGAIQTAKGRRLLFVDTCRSGSAYNARLIKDASDGGIVAFSATNMQQDALELTKLGHGVFTHVLVKGLKGEADVAQEKEVRVFDLGAFVEREVRKLTNGRQTPDFYKKPGAENFVLVRM